MYGDSSRGIAVYYRLVRKLPPGDTCDIMLRFSMGIINSESPSVSDAANHRGAPRKLNFIKLEPTQSPLAELPLTSYHHELSRTLFTDHASMALSLAIGFSAAGEPLCGDSAECMGHRTARHPMTKFAQRQK